MLKLIGYSIKPFLTNVYLRLEQRYNTFVFFIGSNNTNFNNVLILAFLHSTNVDQIATQPEPILPKIKSSYSSPTLYPL